MATKTAGTLATTTLTAVQFSPDPNALSNADFATIVEGIFNDGGFGCPLTMADSQGNQIGNFLQGAFVRSGCLWLPGGRAGSDPLRVFPGDWAAIDGFGNVFLIPQRAMPKTLTLANCTTVSGSPALVFPSSILTLGWQTGTHITGTNIPSGSVLGDIAPTGLFANLYAIATGVKANATGSSAAVTITAGTFTHS